MKIKPVLGDWEIPRIESIRTLERRAFAEFAVPGRVGSLFQDLNTAPARIAISGSLYGDEDRDEFLEELRGKFHDGEPVTFVADILTATEVQYVIVEVMRFQESGTKPDQMDYLFVLRESPPPPPSPDPLGALDTSLLVQAGGFLDTVTGALDVIDTLGSIPDFGNPVEPLSGLLDDFESTTEELPGMLDSLTSLLGEPADE
jgi:hypothetical protein